ncbi:MAG: hypothetical protein ABI577_11060 [bacterium]
MLNTTAELTKPRSHTHHWIIDEVEGPTSEGQCQGCGAQRTFRNWPNEEILQRAQYVAA